MKAIKLSIIFLVLVGGLILALNWESINKPTSDDDFLQEDLIDISSKCNEIRKAWEECLDWDENLYKSIREDIDQSKAMGMFSREGYNTVNNTLRESATNKACDGYLAALHNGGIFSDSKLQEYYKGVQSIKKHENLNDDLRVKNVEVRHELYTNIKRFVNSRHTIRPNFDAQNADWTSFATLQSRILDSARNYRQNKLYMEEMAHIPGFEGGLDESSLKESTTAQRSSFYKDLCSQIIDYFRNETPTPDKIDLLNQIYKDFTDQESDYGVDDLAAFKVNYGED